MTDPYVPQPTAPLPDPTAPDPDDDAAAEELDGDVEDDEVPARFGRPAQGQPDTATFNAATGKPMIGQPGA